MFDKLGGMLVRGVSEYQYLAVYASLTQLKSFAYIRDRKAFGTETFVKPCKRKGAVTVGVRLDNGKYAALSRALFYFPEISLGGAEIYLRPGSVTIIHRLTSLCFCRIKTSTDRYIFLREIRHKAVRCLGTRAETPPRPYGAVKKIRRYNYTLDKGNSQYGSDGNSQTARGGARPPCAVLEK